MLEVKNLKKIYKTQKGADVFALNGVSLKFQEKGMVFLLGKSGSGKSTLLNLCGGLDAPTEGEIIVKGRSSKDFSQSDFDSYRNTFVGFIFQEYNILNEFSVEDNIALALELQGKPKDKQAVAALLDEVDLTGLAKRKPNTLSGGQKQRIAIARALIKSPEIIMADEPTGALDSKTGKQVFDTLKKLSEKKLVIVVSHDRDFAQQYGDRIIELKDGKVLSDISKTQVANKQISENLDSIGDVLHIKKGSALTPEDIKKINDFLKSTSQDVIIATDKNDINNFKKASRINDNNEKEVFVETDENKNPLKTYTKEESRFIRSKLPLKHAFKIGASGLKTKPFRLVFTILLCTIAFTFFSLLSTLSFYDSEATFRQTLLDSNVPLLQLEKQYKARTLWYEFGEQLGDNETYYEGAFSHQELENHISTLSPSAFGGYKYCTSFNVRQNSSRYWQNEIRAYAFLPENNSVISTIEGEYPKNNNEIVISSYFASLLKECVGYDKDGNVIEISSINELIGKTISLQDNTYKITGILQSGEIPAKYEELKTAEGNANYTLQNDFYNYLSDGFHRLVFVTQDRLATIKANNPQYIEKISQYTSVTMGIKRGDEVVYNDWSSTTYDKASNITEKIIPITAETVKDGQILMPSHAFATYVREMGYAIAENIPEDKWEQREKYYAINTLCDEIISGGKYSEIKDTDKKDENPEFTAFTKAEMEQKVASLITFAKNNNIPLTVSYKLFNTRNQSVMGEGYNFEITGIYIPKSTRYGNEIIGVTDADFEKMWNEQKVSFDYYTETTTSYVEPENAIYNVIFLPYENNANAIDSYWDIYSNKEFGENSSRLALSGGFIYSIQSVDGMVKSFSKIFLYVGLVLAVFAILLFSNFISVSISQKKREIGILRAVGARSFDVFKIFFSESFVISVICVILASISSIIVCHFINVSLASTLGASIFVFGPLSLIVLIGIAFATAIIATFLPVYNAAKKKPVDSIRSL